MKACACGVVVFVTSQTLAMVQDFPPIAKAASEGNLAQIVMLIRAGVSPDTSDSDRKTPLMYAAEKGHIDVVKFLLLNKASVGAITLDGVNALHYAASRGNLRIVQYLVVAGADVNAQDTMQRTPLHYAAHNGDYETVRFLVLHGAHVGSRDVVKLSPVDLAYSRTIQEYLDVVVPATMPDTLRLLHASTINNSQDAKLAIAGGADLNAYQFDGNTPLHYMAHYNNWQIAYRLLLNGADPVCKNFAGDMPLQTGLFNNSYKILWLFLSIAYGKNAHESPHFCSYLKSCGKNVHGLDQNHDLGLASCSTQKHVNE